MKLKETFIRKAFSQLADRFCPFLFVDEAGNLLTYNSREDLYYDTLDKLYHLFPNGFVNLDLFLYEACHFDALQTRTLMAMARNSRFLSSSEIIWEWEFASDFGRSIAERIIRSLHLITDTKFDSDAFRCAYDRFVIVLDAKVSKPV